MQVGRRGVTGPPQPIDIEAGAKTKEAEPSWWKSGLVSVALSSSTDSVTTHPLYHEKWGSLLDDISNQVFAQVQANAGTMAEGLGPQIEGAVKDLVGYTLLEIARRGELPKDATPEDVGAHLAANLAEMAKRHLTGAEDKKTAMRNMAREMLETPFPEQGDDPHLPRAARWLLGSGKKNVAVKWGAKLATGALSWTYGLYSGNSYTVDTTGIDWDFLVNTIGDTLYQTYEQVNEVQGAVAQVNMQELEKHPGAKELADSLTDTVMSSVRGMRHLPVELEMFSEQSAPFIDGIFRQVLRGGDEALLTETWSLVESTLQNGVRAVFTTLLKDGGIEGLLDTWMTKVMETGGAWEEARRAIAGMDDESLKSELNSVGLPVQEGNPNSTAAYALATTQPQDAAWRTEAKKLLTLEKFRGFAGELLKDQLQSEQIKALFPSAFPADKALPFIHNIVGGYLFELTEDVQEIREKAAEAKDRLGGLREGSSVIEELESKIDAAIDAFESKAANPAQKFLRTGYGVVDKALRHFFKNTQAQGFRQESKQLIKQVLYIVLADAIGKNPDLTPAEAMQALIKTTVEEGKLALDLVEKTLATFDGLETDEERASLLREGAESIGYTDWDTPEDLRDAIGLKANARSIIEALIDRGPPLDSSIRDQYLALEDPDQQMQLIKDLAKLQEIDVPDDLRVLERQLGAKADPRQLYEEVSRKWAARDVVNVLLPEQTFNSLLPPFLVGGGIWGILADTLAPNLQTLVTQVDETQTALSNLSKEAEGTRERLRQDDPKLLQMLDTNAFPNIDAVFDEYGDDPKAMAEALPPVLDELLKKLLGTGLTSDGLKTLTRNLIFAALQYNLYDASGKKLSSKSVMGMVNRLISKADDKSARQLHIEAAKWHIEEMGLKAFLEGLQAEPQDEKDLWLLEQLRERTPASEWIAQGLSIAGTEAEEGPKAALCQRLDALAIQEQDRHQAIGWLDEVVSDRFIENVIPPSILMQIAKSEATRFDDLRDFLGTFVVSMYSREVRETIEMLQGEVTGEVGKDAKQLATYLESVVGGMARGEGGFGFGAIIDDAAAAAIGSDKGDEVSGVGTLYLNTVSQSIVQRMQQNTHLMEKGFALRALPGFLHTLTSGKKPADFPGENFPRATADLLLGMLYPEGEKELPIPASAQGATFRNTRDTVADIIDEYTKDPLGLTMSFLGAEKIDTSGKKVKATAEEFGEAVKNYAYNFVLETVKARLPEPLASVLGTIAATIARICVWMMVNTDRLYGLLENTENVKGAIWAALKALKKDQVQAGFSLQDEMGTLLKAGLRGPLGIMTQSITTWGTTSFFRHKNVIDFIPQPAKPEASESSK